MKLSSLIPRLFSLIRTRKSGVVIFGVAFLISFLLWLLFYYPRQFGLFTFVVVWFLHLALGAGATYAIIRLWELRRHPMIWRLMVYITAFGIEALTAIVLVFVARGVKFTWKFSAVMFIGALLGDVVRIPLIAYLIKGPTNGALASHEEVSRALPAEFWMREFREAVREELSPIKDELNSVKGRLDKLEH